MNQTPNQSQNRPPVGTLIDFVTGVDADNRLNVEVTVNDQGKVVVFHNRPFKREVSWFEFDLSNSKLDFIMDGGEIRGAGMPLADGMAKYMHNTHQVLMVYIDAKTGEAVEGNYKPLIIHRV